MSEAGDSKLALFELYLATAEKVSDWRARANSWMLSVNSAIVALYGCLQAGEEAVSASDKAVWVWAIPAAGGIVYVAWAALLASYSRLNGAKPKVLHELEKGARLSPLQPRAGVLRGGRAQTSARGRTSLVSSGQHAAVVSTKLVWQ